MSGICIIMALPKIVYVQHPPLSTVNLTDTGFWQFYGCRYSLPERSSCAWEVQTGNWPKVNEVSEKSSVESCLLLTLHYSSEVKITQLLWRQNWNHFMVVILHVSFRKGSSLLWTHTLRPFCSRPIALTQEGRSLVNDVCEYVRDWRVRMVSRHEQLVRYL